ncbi:lysosomal amino acid transporter 1-like [Littorina saxatilis]|uniref:Uncharacterized protein n=1 Tax=Littorina saxatilis TaxID=31220 RepID=A0AAN9G3F3_9CAEN
MASAFYALSFGQVSRRASESGNDTACADGNQYIWIHLDQCLSTPLQWSSFAVGMLSIAIFAWVMIPQIIKNHRNLKNIESISFGLLFCWVIGDTTNFLGAVLTSQGLFQEFLAGWFVFVDMILIMQVVYYHNCYKEKPEHPGPLKNGSLVLCIMGLLSLTAPLNRLMSSGDADSFAPGSRTSRTLLTADVPTAAEPLIPFFHDVKELTGYIIGVVSALFYAGSRTFQILKNKKYKKVAGLERQTFILCIVGNILYGLAIFLYSLDKNYLIEHLPWVVGSWGIVMMDCFVIYQINKYKDLLQEMLNKEVDVNPPSDAYIDEEAPLLNQQYDQYGTLGRYN